MLASQTPGCNVAEITLLGWGGGGVGGERNRQLSSFTLFQAKGKSSLKSSFFSLPSPSAIMHLHRVLCKSWFSNLFLCVLKIKAIFMGYLNWDLRTNPLLRSSLEILWFYLQLQTYWFTLGRERENQWLLGKLRADKVCERETEAKLQPFWDSQIFPYTQSWKKK